MKKIYCFIIVFSIVFTMLCGCTEVQLGMPEDGTTTEAVTEATTEDITASMPMRLKLAYKIKLGETTYTELRDMIGHDGEKIGTNVIRYNDIRTQYRWEIDEESFDIFFQNNSADEPIETAVIIRVRIDSLETGNTTAVTTESTAETVPMSMRMKLISAIKVDETKYETVRDIIGYEGENVGSGLMIMAWEFDGEMFSVHVGAKGVISQASFYLPTD